MSAHEPARGAPTNGLVVVALPVYNAEADVAGALASALGQGELVDVHVFDNASTDRTLEAAAGALPDANIHRAESNRGAIANFQRAFDDTGGEFFLWLAHDDRLGPGAVEHCLAALRAHPGAAAAMPTVRFVDPTGRVESVRLPLPGLAQKSPQRRLWAFVDQLYWVEMYALFRRSALSAAMPLEEGYGFDVVLTWRLLLRQPFCLAPDAVLDYRSAPDQTVDASIAKLSRTGQGVRPRWPNATLWRALWRETGVGGLPPGVRRAGRVALMSAIVRSSTRTRLMRRVRARARRLLS